jgi:SAM-dependent methyltransferase
LDDLEARYRKRASKRWRDRVVRLLEPPAPFVMNPAEPKGFPLGRWNLYIGGAGRVVQVYVNVDLLAIPGVDAAADAQQLPFASNTFQRVECDAVLEHVRDPAQVMREIERVLAPGGYLHLVTPFCHPFHEYPKDFRRFTLDGLKELAGPLEVVAEGWRTGPTASCWSSRSNISSSCFRSAPGGWSRMGCAGGCYSRCGTQTSCCCDPPTRGGSATIAIFGSVNHN